MPALKVDLSLPLGDAGHVRLTIDITDLAGTDDRDREFLADTISEFAAYAARAITPGRATGAMLDPPAVHDPGASVLNGVTGSRIRDKL